MERTIGSERDCGSSSLEHICSIDDLFRPLVHYLTALEVGHLEATSKSLRNHIITTNSDGAWKVLCQRDYLGNSLEAPTWNADNSSFDELQTWTTYKKAYEKWCFWQHRTHQSIQALDMVRSMRAWSRLKNFLRRNNLDAVLNSLCSCPSRDFFRDCVARKIPSSLLAILAVHGGQAGLNPRSADTDFFAGLFGSYTCYNSFYSMRLLNFTGRVTEAVFVPSEISSVPGGLIMGVSVGNPRMFLEVHPSEDDLEGSIVMSYNKQHAQVVARGGMLLYFERYVDRLESGMYPVDEIVPACRGISLFPDVGDTVSCAVTRGIQVKASARWFPSGMMEQRQAGLNFGYSIRIQLVDAEDSFEGTCQLVGRHWEFIDGNGRVRRVDGEAVIGKQPLFFRDKNSDNDGTTSGFVDLGPAGDGVRYPNAGFRYQSQSGPVSGTSPENTGMASVRGTFSFVRGSIENPDGPIFHVTVGSFPLSVPNPFY